MGIFLTGCALNAPAARNGIVSLTIDNRRPITGAGLIGSIAVAICRFVGARHIVVTDLSDYRLGLAKKMGASVTLNPTRESIADAIKTLKMSNGFDVGLEMSGSPASCCQSRRSVSWMPSPPLRWYIHISPAPKERVLR